MPDRKPGSGPWIAPPARQPCYTCAKLDSKFVQCPYCGEAFEIMIDVSAGTAEYVEDRQVCCLPTVFRVTADPDAQVLGIEPRRDDD